MKVTRVFGKIMEMDKENYTIILGVKQDENKINSVKYEYDHSQIEDLYLENNVGYEVSAKLYDNVIVEIKPIENRDATPTQN